MNKVEITLDILMSKRLINTEDFSITRELIEEYLKAYATTGGGNIGKKLNVVLARKIAAINLVEFKIQHKIPVKEGFVYVISNPTWPGFYKIGMSTNPKRRLAQYQTYSPHRDYKLEWFGFFFNRREGEKLLLSKLENHTHEWVKPSKLVLQELRDMTPLV